ncbi:MAG: type IV pilus twitching motility protein PilT [Fibrobacteria bacterium]
MVSIQELLSKMVEMSASDLHITTSKPPLFRVHGNLRAMMTDPLSPEDCLRLAYGVMNEGQRKSFESKKEFDFSFGVANLARFRANVFLQRGCVSMAIRLIPYEIQTLESLGLPRIFGEMIDRPSGLVLVTGPTGSGKSTTLAAMVDKLNSELEGHILTVEDPIEFVHKHKKCIVNQREVKSDTDTFASALRVALRQDPDVVLIGEMRDTETMEAALSIAETGHLTLATLHTNSAAQTINRIVDAFPAGEKSQIRTQLSFVLQGVISQALLPKIGGGRCLAWEVMVMTTGIRAMIRDDKVHQIQSSIEAGQKFGMNTMNAKLVELVQTRKVERTDALSRSPDPEHFERLLAGNFKN